MSTHRAYLYAALGLFSALGGCATQSQMLDQSQSMAVNAVLERTRFDWSCPNATATVLSREMIQPALDGIRVGGILRAEYTVGVAGCGHRASFVVICPEGGAGCFATGSGPFHPEWQNQ